MFCYSPKLKKPWTYLKFKKILIKVMIMTLMIKIKATIHHDIIIVIIIIIIIMVVNSYPRSLFP